jgi:hypothetical protein
MTTPHLPVRTYDRAEVESILLEAARLDEMRGSEPRRMASPVSGGDGLTLADVERAAAEAGISRGAVSAASLRVALREATDAPRTHVVHEIAGSLPPAALERLADDLRTRIPASRVRATADGIDVEVGKGEGEPGSLLVKVRAKGDATTLSAWSVAPALTRGDLAAVAVVGAPAALFPVVASSGGVWPALASALAIGAVGLAAGTGIGVAANRWRTARWQQRAADAVITIASCVGSHTLERVAAPIVDPIQELGEG